MQYKCIHQQSILKKITRKDSLFQGSYTIDPYQYCEFDCTYCDSTYDNTIYITCNAPTLFSKELTQIEQGWIILGSVHDPYQPIEEKYEITRELLTILKKENIPTHILTKSKLIERDLDILTHMHHVRVTFSIPSMQPRFHRLFEGITPPPEKRLETMKKIAEHHIETGIAIIPIFPSINDCKESLTTLITEAKMHQATYILHQYLEIKGDQKEKILELIKHSYPQLATLYTMYYDQNIRPPVSYTAKIDKRIKQICEQNHIPFYLSN